jgi:ribosomal protein S18 acetylase RimI-like enzyme
VTAGSSFVTPGGDLRLSNPGQLELLRGVAERGVPLRTTVRGFSMSPFIRDGDVVTFEPFAGEPRVGDVVAVALLQGRMAVHRVVARTPQGWVVRGDNCPEPDGVFGSGDFVARVVRVERGGHDVRLGLGDQGRWVAVAGRGGWLSRARWARHAPRRAAGSAARAAQGLPAYRQAGRRLAPRFSIADADERDLAALLRRSGTTAAQNGSAGPGPRVRRFAARVRGRTAGFVEFVDHRQLDGPWSGCWLSSLEVWPLYRGMGLGEALSRAVIDEARRRGATELLLVVHEDQRRAVRLYLKLGFAGTVAPGLESLLQAEASRTGRRRRAMRLSLGVSAEGVV